MTSSYYLWRWADNDLPGKPTEVFAALTRGELHPALQSFDARPVLRRLQNLAAQRRKRGEEWDWQVQPPENPAVARFVFLSCPSLNGSKDRAICFSRALQGLGISGYDEQYGHVIHLLRPKLNCFLFGQDHRERHYDITAEEVPLLLHRIDRQARDPFAVLQDRRLCLVQCYAHKRQFCVEWRENHDPDNWDDFEHWRALAPARRGVSRDKDRLRQGHASHSVLRFADTVRIFQAFLNGEPRPTSYRWRSIKKELAEEDKPRKTSKRRRR